MFRQPWQSCNLFKHAVSSERRSACVNHEVAFALQTATFAIKPAIPAAAPMVRAPAQPTQHRRPDDSSRLKRRGDISQLFWPAVCRRPRRWFSGFLTFSRVFQSNAAQYRQQPPPRREMTSGSSVVRLCASEILPARPARSVAAARHISCQSTNFKCRCASGTISVIRDDISLPLQGTLIRAASATAQTAATGVIGRGIASGCASKQSSRFPPWRSGNLDDP